jgi:hypothetical protein
MERHNWILLAALCGACAAPERRDRPAADDPTHAIARELVDLERRAPEPPRRIRPDVEIERHDPRDVRYRPTGTASTATYELRSANGESRLVLTRRERQVRVDANGEAWMFERNPVAPEHVLGTLADHAEHALVEYPFSDLCAEGRVTSWSSLARGGVAPDELESMRPTGRSVERFGLTFEERVGGGGGDLALRSVLWNEEHQLPARLERACGDVAELVELRLEPVAPPLERFRAQFPGYETFDVSDWREALHDRHEHP